MCPCFLGDTQRWSGFCCFCPGALIEQLKSGGKFKISFLILGIVTEPPLWRVCVSGIQVSQVSGKSTDLSFWSVADSDFFFSLYVVFKSMWDKRVVPALQSSHFGACFLPLGFKQMPECVQMSVAVQCRWRHKESACKCVFKSNNIRTLYKL